MALNSGQAQQVKKNLRSNSPRFEIEVIFNLIIGKTDSGSTLSLPTAVRNNLPMSSTAFRAETPKMTINVNRL